MKGSMMGLMLLKLSPKLSLKVMMGLAIALVFEMGLPLFSDQPMGAIAQAKTNEQQHAKEVSQLNNYTNQLASRATQPTSSSSRKRRGGGVGR